MKLRNHRLRLGALALNYFGVFPKGGRVRGREISPFWFNKLHNTAHGSARGDMDNAFHQDCVFLGDDVTIRTQAMVTRGYSFYGREDWKSARSGLCWVDNLAPSGDYYFRVRFDEHAKGCWEAIWFLQPYPYREVDIERVDDKIYFCVHYGQTSTAGRDMYNSFIRMPYRDCVFRVRFGKRLKIYLNGVLCFVGKDFIIDKPMRLIINSGLVKDGFYRSNLRIQDSFLKVRAWKH